MGDREKAIQLLNGMPENKLTFAINMLEKIKGLPDEEVKPDEQDLDMTAQAQKENDWTTVFFEEILKLPPDGIEVMELAGTELYRLHVGNYRIIFTIDGMAKMIAIEKVDDRGDVYKLL